ncbi:MAG TPA: hypothetical protein VLI04_14590, partial [Nocardioidaceae bacterium]|nr:hypothetical protein [Nocardioidaceae bacterium]
MTFLRTVGDLSGSWLSDALGAPVRGFATKEVGTGQCASTYRVTLDWDGPHETVILKIADPDP